MARGIMRARRYLATRSRRFWIGLGAAALALAASAVALPPSAFAGDATQLVLASADTTDNALTVTARCPSGKTAVGVTAEVGGSAAVTVNELTPQGNRGVAHAVRTAGHESWSLTAKALCVRHTTDIEYLSKSSPTDQHSGNDNVRVLCRGHKELIGFGWRVDPIARPDAVTPLFASGSGGPGGTGTGSTGTGGFPGTGGGGTGTGGFPGTGTGGFPGTGGGGTGTGTGGGSATNAFGVEMSSTVMADRDVRAVESLVAVCATGGHGTVGVTHTTPAPRGRYDLAATCPTHTHVNALGFGLQQFTSRGQLMRRLTVDRADVTGTLEAVNLGAAGRPGSNADTAVTVLCAAS